MADVNVKLQRLFSSFQNDQPSASQQKPTAPPTTTLPPPPQLFPTQPNINSSSSIVNSSSLATSSPQNPLSTTTANPNMSISLFQLLSMPGSTTVGELLQQQSQLNQQLASSHSLLQNTNQNTPSNSNLNSSFERFQSVFESQQASNNISSLFNNFVPNSNNSSSIVSNPIDILNQRYSGSEAAPPPQPPTFDFNAFLSATTVAQDIQAAPGTITPNRESPVTDVEIASAAAALQSTPIQISKQRNNNRSKRNKQNNGNVSNDSYNNGQQINNINSIQLSASPNFAKMLASNKTMDTKKIENIIKQCKIPTEILDDLASRFVLNMPQEEKEDPIRICFQIEIAFWFYIDFYCESLPDLPRFKLKRFAYVMFTYIPRLRKLLNVFDQVITNWIDYKFSIPCSGAVLLDKTMNYVLLVQGYGSRTWSFPKGKVNHDEPLMNCAIREVMEETGYDCSDKIQEGIYMERKIFDSRVRLFIVTGVEMDFNFKPHVRNEIRSIQWFMMSELPMKIQKKILHSSSNQQDASLPVKFFSVIPFVSNIRRWIDKEKKRQKKVTKEQRRRQRQSSNETDDSNEKEECDADGGSGGSNSGWEVLEDGNGGGGASDGNGVISVMNQRDDDQNAAASVSPFTIAEEQQNNESTSFVNVKLDDILDLSYTPSSKQQNQFHITQNQSTIITGFNVFNADEDDKIMLVKGSGSVSSTTSSSNGKLLQQQQQQWSTNWQGLLTEYNRLSVTPSSNGEMMAAAKSSPIPMSSRGPAVVTNSQNCDDASSSGNSSVSNSNGGNLLSNLILAHNNASGGHLGPLTTPNQLLKNPNSSGPSVSTMQSSSPIPPGFNSKFQSCDDKLSFLFGSMCQSPTTATPASINNSGSNLSAIGFNNKSSPKPQPNQHQQPIVNAVQATTSSPIVNSFNNSSNSFNGSINNSHNNSSAMLRQQQSPAPAALNKSQSNGTSINSPFAKLLNNSLLFNSMGNGVINNHQQPQPTTKPIQPIGTAPVAAPVAVAAPKPVVPTNSSQYNGLDQKSLPLVEEKIQQLLERFKYLNAN